MNLLRQQAPLAIALVVGVVMIIQYYVPTHLSNQVGQRTSDGFIIIRGLVIFLGIASLLHTHLRKVTRKEAGWGYSLFMFAGLALMLFFGFSSQGSLDRGTSFKWMYDYTMSPLSATLFSILAFFIASAAFRAFRARSLDATLLLLAAVIVMFAKVPWGEYFTDLVLGPNAAKETVAWIMKVPNAAATRGILIGVALGLVATSLKIIFGIERSYLGESE
jgi:hypothetical protein